MGIGDSASPGYAAFNSSRHQLSGIAPGCYTFEAVWKTTRQYLADHEGIDVASPKGCVRAARRVGVLTDEQSEAALVMTDDRNLLVHTYKEPLAVEVFSHLGAHATVLRAWLDAIRTHVEKS